MDIIFFYWILEIDLLSITSPYSGTLQTNELFPWICEACLSYLHFPQSLLIACFIVGLYVHKNMLDPVQAPFRRGGGGYFHRVAAPGHGCFAELIVSLSLVSPTIKWEWFCLQKLCWLNYCRPLAELSLCLSGIIVDSLVKVQAGFSSFIQCPISALRIKGLQEKYTGISFF